MESSTGFPRLKVLAGLLSGVDIRADRLPLGDAQPLPLGDAQPPWGRKSFLPRLPQLMVFHFAKGKTLSLTIIPSFHTRSSHGWEKQPLPCSPYLYSNLVLQAAVGRQHL